jgi:hypothetical protein
MRDLRAFLDVLRREGDLVEVDAECDPYLEIADLDPAHGPAYLSIEVTHAGALDHEDAQELSEDLEPGSSALLVAFENTWAAKFADAIIASEAVVIDTIRIPAAVVDDFVASAFE